MKVSFIPRLSKRTGSISIYVRIIINGKRIKTDFYSGIKCDKREWDKRRNRLKGKNNLVKNRILDSIKDKIEEHYYYLLLRKEIITPELLKSKYIASISEKSHSLLTYYKEWANKQSIKKDIVESSGKAFLYRYRLFEKYLKEINQANMLFENLKVKHFNDFYFWMINSREFSYSYAMKNIQVLKTVCRNAINDDIISKMPYGELSFKSHKRIPFVYLDKEELDLIENSKFQLERLERCKDVFLFQVYTGLAYVDLKNLDFKKNVRLKNNKYWITSERQKTHNSFEIPLVKDAYVIWEKYHFYLPVLSNQKYNAFLKEMAEILGINKRLTTHVARKTAGMVWLNKYKVSLECVQRMLGHTSIKTTEKFYAKVLSDRLSDEITEAFSEDW